MHPMHPEKKRNTPSHNLASVRPENFVRVKTAIFFQCYFFAIPTYAVIIANSIPFCLNFVLQRQGNFTIPSTASPGKP